MICGEILWYGAARNIKRVCVEERFTEHDHSDYPASRPLTDDDRLSPVCEECGCQYVLDQREVALRGG